MPLNRASFPSFLSTKPHNIHSFIMSTTQHKVTLSFPLTVHDAVTIDNAKQALSDALAEHNLLPPVCEDGETNVGDIPAAALRVAFDANIDKLFGTNQAAASSSDPILAMTVKTADRALLDALYSVYCKCADFDAVDTMGGVDLIRATFRANLEVLCLVDTKTTPPRSSTLGSGNPEDTAVIEGTFHGKDLTQATIEEKFRGLKH
jgi:hypothetical protein